MQRGVALVKIKDNRSKKKKKKLLAYCLRNPSPVIQSKRPICFFFQEVKRNLELGALMVHRNDTEILSESLTYCHLSCR